MTAHSPAVIDNIKRNLVGLKMPRALEILDVTVRGIESGEMTALEAIEPCDAWRSLGPSCLRAMPQVQPAP